MKYKTPKVGDLVRYRRTGSHKPVYGIVIEQVRKYSIKVHVYSSDDSWFCHDKFWDKSHWEVVSESP